MAGFRSPHAASVFETDFQAKEFAGVAGVRALMVVVNASGASITAVLAADLRDIPAGRGLEELSQA